MKSDDGDIDSMWMDYTLYFNERFIININILDLDADCSKVAVVGILI